MTGEHSRNDDLDQDDDFYVLGDEDTDVAPPRESTDTTSSPRRGAFAQTSSQEEDLLFTPTDAQQSVGPESSFVERQGRNWGGAGLSAEAIGIPIESDAKEPAEEPLLPEAAESTEGPFAEEEKLEVFDVNTSSPRLVAVEPESDLGLVDDEQGGFHDDDLAASAEPPRLHPRRTVHLTDRGTPDVPMPELRADTDAEAEEVVANLSDAAESVEGEAEAAVEAELGGEPTVFLDENGELVQEDVAQPEAEAAQDDWAPVEANADPLAAGVEAVVAAEALANGSQEQEFAAEGEAEAEPVGVGEEAFVEAEQGPTLVAVGAGDRPRRRGGLLAAAALLLVGGGGFFAYQRGWLTNPEPENTTRAEIPRPIGYQATQPPVPTKIPASQPTSVAHQPDPEVEIAVPTPKVTPESLPTRTPDEEPPKVEIAKTPDPKVEDPKPTDPKTTDPKVGDPLPPVAVTTPDPTKELGTVQIGEGLTMREAPKDPTSKPANSGLRSILPGSQAFAQLHNGNFFVGNVKAVDADFVTLRLEKGEVTLSVTELKTIVPLASSEYQQLKKVDQGFVRLNNRNRLLGTILATKDENIILENKANRVVIPKSAIEELGTVGRTSVRLADEDNTWVDRVIEKQLSDRAPKADAQKPTTDGKGKKTPPKVKSVVGDDAAARPK